MRDIDRIKLQRHSAIWLPGWLLLGSSLLLFALLHLRTLSWAPGILYKAPRFYWDLIIKQVGVGALIAGPLSPLAPTHRIWLAGGFLFAGMCYVLALTRARRNSGGITLRSILLWTIAASIPLVLVPNLLSRDIYSYIMYGRIAAIDGGNPFVDLPLQFWRDPYLAYVGWKTVPSVYGPVWILLSAWLTRAVEFLGGGVNLYLLGYKLIAMGAHLVSVALLWDILGRWKPRQQAWGTLLYAWNPLVLIEFVGSAHNDVLMILALLLALWLHLRHRPYLAILALVLGMLVKWTVAALIPLYGLLLLWEAPNWSARIRLAVGSALITAIVVVATYGPFWAGPNTLNALTKAPPSTRMINSLGEFAVDESLYLRFTWFMHDYGAYGAFGPLASIRSPQFTSGEPGLSLDALGNNTPAQGQPKTLAQSLSAAFSDMMRSLLDSITEDSVRKAGEIAFVLVWLLFAVRVRDLETLVQSWAWTLFAYIAWTSVWFWPWYVTWFVALAALLDWRRTALTAIIFSVSALMIYVTYPFTVAPSQLARDRAIIVFGPPLLYLAGTLAVLLRRIRFNRSRQKRHRSFAPVRRSAAVR